MPLDIKHEALLYENRLAGEAHGKAAELVPYHLSMSKSELN